MNAAKVENSPRLQRVRDYLAKDGLWHTTKDIIYSANVCAVNSCIAELKDPRNGYKIEFAWRSGAPMYRMVM